MKKSFKQLKTKYWPTLRELIILRDSEKCQICRNTKCLQVDHCFTRSIQVLHFDPRNLTTLCSKCHLLKSYDKQDYVDMVKDIVKKREGVETYESLRKLSRVSGSISEDRVREYIGQAVREWGSIIGKKWVY